MAEGLPTAQSWPSRDCLRPSRKGVAITMSPSQLGRYMIVFPVTPHAHEAVVPDRIVLLPGPPHAFVDPLDLFRHEPLLRVPRLFVARLDGGDDPGVFGNLRIAVGEGAEMILYLLHQQVDLSPEVHAGLVGEVVEA